MSSHSRPRSSTLLAGVAGVTTVAAVAAFTAAPAAQGVARAGSHPFHVVRMVSDQAGRAPVTDPSLVNAWGLALTPTSPLWVSDNGTDASTLYSGATAPSSPAAKVPLTVSIPGGGAPTGVVFNPTTRFVLSTHGKTGPALFIFAGEHGSLTAWNQTGALAEAVPVAHSRNTVYKGLTMVTMRGRPFLLAANFGRDRIDVFNSHFARVRMPSAFRNRGIPQGYAPFNVARLGNRVYVSYAKQDPAKQDDVPGRGHGFVNVFADNGHFQRSLLRRGVLDSPWGMAVAPTGFGGFAGRLLVGNFGNGRIHVVNQRTGHVVATLRTAAGHPISIDGLWGLLPGNGTAGGTSDVLFSAGPGGESHGLVGLLRAGS